jgi:hypothetical protein
MKAQKIRKTFWLVSLILGLGVAGVGALVVLTKPAEAKDVVTRARAVMEEYKTKQPVKVLQASVKEEDLKKEILRPDWKGLPYYPYAGPRIPAPTPTKVEEKVVVEGPKDLAAIGRVSMLLFTPPPEGESVAKDTVVFWEFSSDKKKIAFVPGEFIRPNDKTPERFKLIDVVRITPDISRFRLVYDIFEDANDKTKSRRAELLYDGEPKIDEKDIKILPELRPKPVEPVAAAAGGTKPAAGTTGTAATTPAEPEAVATSTDPGGWKPEIKTVNSGRRDVQFDEATFKHWKGKKIEDVLENVRTENYDKNGVQGVQIFPLDGNDMAAKFDIRRHDVLVSINGQAVKSKDDAIRVGRSIPPDSDRVTVVIDRDGRQITYNVDPRDPKARRAAGSLVR